MIISINSQRPGLGLLSDSMASQRALYRDLLVLDYFFSFDSSRLVSVTIFLEV
jgi:hypothetical protein